MMKDQSPAQIVRASTSFRLHRHTLPGFPLVLDASGCLIEPIFDFLRAEAVQRHLAPGSLLDEAYALRDWWTYVSSLPSAQPLNLDALITWTGAELERGRTGGEKVKSRRRLARCLDVVGRFHRHLLHDRAYQPGAESWRSSSYVDRLDRRLADREFAKVTFAHSPHRQNGGRPTPREDEVERVLDQLGSSDNSYLAARNWLIGRWMRDVGLRRSGVASMTVEGIRLALIGEGLLRREEYFTRAGTTLRSRMEMRAAIDRFRATGRTFVVGEVTEKGAKTREIKIPLPLLRQTLDFVWSERAQVTTRSPKLQGALWLSLKTSRGLSPVAIGGIIKDAFNETGVAGSGHRLRACFAEEVVFRLYNASKEHLGILFDENQILIDAAEELGHSNWHSLRHYLNRAARNYAAQSRRIGLGA